MRFKIYFFNTNQSGMHLSQYWAPKLNCSCFRYPALDVRWGVKNQEISYRWLIKWIVSLYRFGQFSIHELIFDVKLKPR